MNIENKYKPVILENIKISGMAAESALPGEKFKIVQRSFIYSDDEDFALITSNLLHIFCKEDIGESLNTILIIIKPDNRAFVYKNFPMGFNGIVKRSCKKLERMYKSDFVDITSVFFYDDLIDLNPVDGDKIIWLFRINWCFGLYFDLSGNLKKDDALIEMGYCFRKLLYLQEYKYVENSEKFDQIINDGWFPFIALLGDGFNKIMTYYNEEKKHHSIIEDLFEKFDDATINNLISKWWKNPIFNSKKDILIAAINSYLSYTKDGYINAIKNLSTELEGIIRLSFHSEYKQKPTTKEIKEYITIKGKNRFGEKHSLTFPEKFIEYLDKYIFKGFDVEINEIPESRHSVAHGVANIDIYNREFVFKLILALDQVYFYLG